MVPALWGGELVHVEEEENDTDEEEEEEQKGKVEAGGTPLSAAGRNSLLPSGKLHT